MTSPVEQATPGESASASGATATGPLLLLLAVLIFGASNAVIRKLTELGSQQLIDGRNPISFCNVLFVGNFCALIVLMHIYYREWSLAGLWRLSTEQKLAMVTVATLGTAIAPALIFIALGQTPVNTVVLISRIEPPLILALSVILLNERVNGWVVAGAPMSFVGVLLTIALQPHGPNDPMMGIGTGEFYTALAAIALAVSTIISKISLKRIPLGIFSVFRMMLGTVVFFVIAAALFTPRHFSEIGAPFLWRWIVLYSVVIIVAGQLLWFNGLRRSTAREVSLASTLNPVAGFMAAFLILGEQPTQAQIIGGGVILLGMLLNHLGLRQLTAAEPALAPDDRTLPDSLGFRGV